MICKFLSLSYPDSALSLIVVVVRPGVQRYSVAGPAAANAAAGRVAVITVIGGVKCIADIVGDLH